MIAAALSHPQTADSAIPAQHVRSLVTSLERLEECRRAAEEDLKDLLVEVVHDLPHRRRPSPVTRTGIIGDWWLL